MLREKQEQAPAASEDSPSLLAVVLDVNPWYWGARRLEMEEQMKDEREESDELFCFPDFMEHLLVFLNSYLTLNESNLLTIIASHPTQNQYVFPTDDSQDSIGSRTFLHTQFGRLRERFWPTLLNTLEHLQTDSKSDSAQASNISGAIALALCCTSFLHPFSL